MDSRIIFGVPKKKEVNMWYFLSNYGAFGAFGLLWLFFRIVSAHKNGIKSAIKEFAPLIYALQDAALNVSMSEDKEAERTGKYKELITMYERELGREVTGEIMFIDVWMMGKRDRFKDWEEYKKGGLL